MRWQTSAVLAVALVLLGGFYYLYEVRWAPEREQAESRKGRVFRAETADVTAVEVKRREDTIRLTRDGDSWKLVAPVAARGNRPTVEEVLTTILTAKSDREIEAAPKTLADYGLDAPAADVKLTLKDGTTLGLTLGSKTPTGVWVYAREAGKAPVFVLSDSVLRDATRPVADFRDRTILAFERKDVTGVELALADETVVLEPEGSKWRMTRPSPRAADAEAMNELFEKLATAKVKEFVAEAPASLAPYGLQRPIALTIHTGRDKDRASRTLLIGREDPQRQGVYAVRSGESSVLLLPGDVAKAVPRTVAALRDRQLVDLDRDKVTRVDIESPRGAVTLAREKDAWAITAPQPLPADQTEAGALLARLRELRAQAFLSDDASGIARFLARPTVKVTVTEQGRPPATLLLAPSPERRGGQPSAYAALAGRGPVVLVEGKALEELGRSATELRDRRAFVGLDPKDVKRMRVQAGGQTVVLERSGDSDWRLVEPTKGAAKAARVEDLLYSVRALRWKDIVAPGGEDPARYGLDKPSMEVVLLRADGSEAARLAVGKREGDQGYVRLGGAPAIYAVESRALPSEPKLPDEVKG